MQKLSRQDAMTFYTADHQGVCMAFWRDASVTYCIAADATLSEDRVLALASTACRQVRAASIARTPSTPQRDGLDGVLAMNMRHGE
jgi:hypothetical protein